jgi:hypothetical protein
MSTTDSEPQSSIDFYESWRAQSDTTIYLYESIVVVFGHTLAHVTLDNRGRICAADVFDAACVLFHITMATLVEQLFPN